MNLFRRFAALFRKEKLDREMADEMRFHLEQRAAENVADGVSPEDARYAAQRKFGNLGLIQETARDGRAFAWLDGLAKDLRFALRSLRKSPGFTSIALLTLALGIGVNTAAFSLLNALLLHTVPYPRPDELVRVYNSSRGSHAPANFLDHQARNTVFEHMAAFRSASFNLAAPGYPADRLQGLLVTADFFPLLGIQPALGRVFTSEENRPGNDAVLIISHAFWLQRFGGDASVLGREIRIDGKPVRVVGVMPAGFADYKLWGDVAAWRPLALSAPAWADRDNMNIGAIARLKPGVSLAQAQSSMDVLGAQLAAAYPQSTSAGMGVHLVSLGRTIQDEMGRDITWLVMGLAGFVLLIACANLANLQFARNAARGREHAVRAALGASRAQLMGRVLLESLLLSLGGGALGCLVGHWVNDLAGRHYMLGEHVGLDVPLDLRVLGFTFAVSVLTGIGFGLLPAWLASRANVSDALKLGGRNLTVARSHHRLRHALIVGEVALALVLLAGAGFFLRGLQGYAARDPGWQTDGLLTAQLYLRGLSSQKEAAFHEQLHARLAELPGVERVAIATSLPTLGFSHGRRFAVEGQPEPEPRLAPSARYVSVTPGFLATMGIRLLQGRDFTADDRAGKPAVIVVNESMARKLWPGENPLGKRIGDRSPHLSNLLEVVGVVSDVQPVGALIESEGRFQIYYPLAQRPPDSATIALRTRATPEAFAQQLRRIVAEMDPDQAVHQIGTVQQAVRRSLASFNAAAWTLAGFACLGVLLAAVGIYGVIAGFVAQRTNEIGIRMALGAQIRDVLRLVLGQGLHLALLGTALGLGGAFAIARLLASIIPALPSAEPLTAAAVAFLLVTVALFACWLPARRAAKVNPMVALRAE